MQNTSVYLNVSRHPSPYLSPLTADVLVPCLLPPEGPSYVGEPKYRHNFTLVYRERKFQSIYFVVNKRVHSVQCFYFHSPWTHTVCTVSHLSNHLQPWPTLPPMGYPSNPAISDSTKKNIFIICC